MVEERDMRCLRCGHEYRAPYMKDGGIPIERHCPECRSNSVRALAKKKASPKTAVTPKKASS